MMYQLRQGGSNNFVSRIDPHDKTCYPPGSVEYVPGWTNPAAMTFATMELATSAKTLAENIDGVHLSIEEIHADDAPTEQQRFSEYRRRCDREGKEY